MSYAVESKHFFNKEHLHKTAFPAHYMGNHRIVTKDIKSTLCYILKSLFAYLLISSLLKKVITLVKIYLFTVFKHL